MPKTFGILEMLRVKRVGTLFIPVGVDGPQNNANGTFTCMVLLMYFYQKDTILFNDGLLVLELEAKQNRENIYVLEFCGIFIN